MRAFKHLLYNLNIILAGVFITFQILDLYNPKMHFLGSGLSVWLMFLFCILSVINAVTLLVKSHKAAKVKTLKQLWDEEKNAK